MLLARKADTNLENADTLETCLHLAAATYRNDEQGETLTYMLIICLIGDGTWIFSTSCR